MLGLCMYLYTYMYIYIYIYSISHCFSFSLYCVGVSIVLSISSLGPNVRVGRLKRPFCFKTRFVLSLMSIKSLFKITKTQKQNNAKLFETSALTYPDSYNMFGGFLASRLFFNSMIFFYFLGWSTFFTHFIHICSAF